MSRLQATLAQCKAEGRGGLSIYLSGGDPDVAQSEACMRAAIDAGADWLEIGIPFSDPAADGPVIQAATQRAVSQGIRVAEVLGIAKRIRADYPEVPLVAMTYANLAFQATWTGFAKQLSDAGLDGLILPDVPLEESEPVRAALAAQGIAWVPLVTPSTPPERMAAIAATATGFLYVVGNVGITGQSDPGPLVEATVAKARAAGALVPLVVGFGIAEPADVHRVIAAGADAAIVGTAVVSLVPDLVAIKTKVAALREAT